MTLVLLPQPKQVHVGKGFFSLPAGGTLGLSNPDFIGAAEDACSFLPDYHVIASRPRAEGTIAIEDNHGLKPEQYRLRIGPQGVRLQAGTARGAFWAVQTLRQIVRQSPGNRLPALTVDDWPDFADRGVYYDVTRGRVPKLERFIEMAGYLSQYKINQLQLYIEHTFRFRSHPEIGRNASPLTADDILELDEYCLERHIELVPSLSSFGHLSHVLTLPRYRHLAEDLGVGRYLNPEADKLASWQKNNGWTLSPVNPRTYEFLDSLFAEFLPLFTSDRFNVCCDETWDLGLGQSYERCRRIGKGRVYLEHILKLRDLAARHGKRIMFWGDIIRHYPDLLPRIPKDVTLLDWGYDHHHPFERIRDFKTAGIPHFYACPGTGSWNAMFPRLPEACANIHGFAAAGKRNGATGLLNTDWGDGGHYNFMEFSWPGYCFGAEQSWNSAADTRRFSARFCRLFLGTRSRDLSDALDLLGDIAQLQIRGNTSAWQQIFFARPDAEFFDGKARDAWTSNHGRIIRKKIRLDPAYGRKVLTQLKQIREVFCRHALNKAEDPVGVLPYWIFAVDTLAHAARKIVALHAGRSTRASRSALARELRGLMTRFQKLWADRNRPSEINITLSRYRDVLKSLR